MAPLLNFGNCLSQKLVWKISLSERMSDTDDGDVFGIIYNEKIHLNLRKHFVSSVMLLSLAQQDFWCADSVFVLVTHYHPISLLMINTLTSGIKSSANTAATKRKTSGLSWNRSMFTVHHCRCSHLLTIFTDHNCSPLFTIFTTVQYYAKLTSWHKCSTVQEVMLSSHHQQSIISSSAIYHLLISKQGG